MYHHVKSGTYMVLFCVQTQTFDLQYMGHRVLESFKELPAFGNATHIYITVYTSPHDLFLA